MWPFAYHVELLLSNMICFLTKSKIALASTSHAHQKFYIKYLTQVKKSLTCLSYQLYAFTKDDLIQSTCTSHTVYS